MKPCARLASVEQPVPQLLVPALGLDAQLEGDAAQHQAHQHGGHRQVERAEDLAMRDRERHQQQADAEHQPGLVRIPERADRGHHAVLLVALRRGHQHADAEVVAVEHHVGEDRRAHQHREHDRQIDAH
jgi:hypothetical protein